MEPIEQQLTAAVNDLKGLLAKRDEEIKNLGSALTETKNALEAQRTDVATLHTQLDAIDAKNRERHVEDQQKTESEKTIPELISEHPEFVEGKTKGFMGKKPIYMTFNHSAFPRKSLISGVGLGSGTAGVMPVQQWAGITGLAQQRLRVRDLMNVRTQTEGTDFAWLKQTTRTNNASPQGEGGLKGESTYAWSVESSRIRTIAHWTNVTRQALSDIPWLRQQLDAELIYGLKLKEEAEILAGSGTGEHLDGIITQAAAFNASLMPDSNWTIIDVLRIAKLQSRLAGQDTFAPDGFVLHPTDMAYLEMVKDLNGLYIVGDPKTGAMVKTLWDLPVVESFSITQGTFLVGPFGTGVDLVDRQFTTVDISYEHDVNFTHNLATIRAEERIGMGVRTPSVFITGSLASSPA